MPYYIYSIWKTHPDSFVKIFIEDALQPNVLRSLKYLKDNGIRNFEIIDFNLFYTEFEEHLKTGGGGKKTIRWLIGNEHYKDYEYVYVGDVDILFLFEEESIIEFHQKQLSKFNLPFSNKVRVDENGYPIGRLTGLHFFKTKEYFEKTTPIINRLKKDRSYWEAYVNGLERNEHFLYKLNKEAFGFDDLELAKAERPWHGLHLGITRGDNTLDIETILANSSLSIDEIRRQLKEYQKDPIFRNIQKLVFVIELEEVYRSLSIPYSFSWKLKSFRPRLRKTKRLTRKKIKRFLKSLVR